MLKNILPTLYGYGNILLRTYIEIADTNDLSLLVRSGSPTPEQLVEAWEGIVKENSTMSGDRSYDNYFDLIKDYNDLIAKHTVIVSCFDLLALCTMDWPRLANMFDVLDIVRSAGYKIDTDDVMKFAKGIVYSKRKASNMITQCERKRKEIERQFPPQEEGESKKVSYEEIIGHLELALERSVMDSETITLAKYNVLRKGVEERRKAQEKNNRKGG